MRSVDEYSAGFGPLRLIRPHREHLKEAVEEAKLRRRRAPASMRLRRSSRANASPRTRTRLACSTSRPSAGPPSQTTSTGARTCASTSRRQCSRGVRCPGGGRTGSHRRHAPCREGEGAQPHQDRREPARAWPAVRAARARGRCRGQRAPARGPARALQGGSGGFLYISICRRTFSLV